MVLTQERRKIKETTDYLVRLQVSRAKSTKLHSSQASAVGNALREKCAIYSQLTLAPE